MLTVSKSSKTQAATDANKNYFSSETPVSSRRMLENLEESVWMTKHLAQRMTTYVAVTTIIVFLVAFLP